MTDPDLHALAADALVRADLGGELLDLDPDDQGAYCDQADAVLAAVLPAHRRQVLTEAAEVLARDALCNEDTRYDYLAGAAVVVRRLASAAPETAPTPRHGDETAPAVPEATPEPAEGDRAGVLDEAPWIAGGPNARIPGRHIYRAGRETPIGTMDTPDLAAQVVAEHRHAVEFRAMMRAAEQRFAERGAEGRRDDTAALAARLGFVPAAELQTARDALTNARAVASDRIADLDKICRDVMAERDSARAALAAANAALDRARPVIETANALAAAAWNSSAPRTPIFQAFLDAVAALAAADGPPLPANTDPKAGDDG